MNALISASALTCCAFFLCLFAPDTDDWGFFGHRLINKKAVFTLPRDMIPFFKHHIDYLSAHAVDPDKRRYATRHEAVRHYIDLDQWGEYPFKHVPRNRTDALARHTMVQLINGADTIALIDSTLPFRMTDTIFIFHSNLCPDTLRLDFQTFRKFFINHFLQQYYEDEWTTPADSFPGLQEFCRIDSTHGSLVVAEDAFSPHGILPYHLMHMQKRLTEAFRQKDQDAILRLAADFGHYIGDAHVPLHTTSNYNGQLTNQLGIHAFWESRLPELFAEESYDFFVGRANYIEDPQSWYWTMVLESHLLVDSALAIEKRLSTTFPAEQQFCYDERLGRVVRTQCRDYATAYHQALNGQVERRMREAVHAVGSAWYTAWVDAGQPILHPTEMPPGNARINQADDQTPELEDAAKSRTSRNHEQ